MKTVVQFIMYSFILCKFTVRPQELHNELVASFVQEYDQDTILLRHPSNCRSYFVCNAEHSARRLCPDCEQFNPILKRCSSDRMSINCMGTYPRCRLLRNGTVTPNLEDCTKYFLCVNGDAEEIQCPSNFHYSEELGICTDRMANVNDQCFVERCKKSGQFVPHRFDYSKYCVCQTFTNLVNMPILAVLEIGTCPLNESFDETLENCTQNFSEIVDRKVSRLVDSSDDYLDVNITNNFYCYKYRHCRIYEEKCASNSFFSTRLQNCHGYEHSDCKHDYVKNELRILILTLTVSLILSFVLRKYFNNVSKYRRKISLYLLNKLFLLKQIPLSIQNSPKNGNVGSNITDPLFVRESVVADGESVAILTTNIIE